MLEDLLSDILQFLLLWASLGLSLEWEKRTNATCPLAVPLGGGELQMAEDLYGVEEHTPGHAPGVGVEGGGFALSSPHLAVSCSDLVQRLYNQCLEGLNSCPLFLKKEKQHQIKPGADRKLLGFIPQ